MWEIPVGLTLLHMVLKIPTFGPNFSWQRFAIVITFRQLLKKYWIWKHNDRVLLNSFSHGIHIGKMVIFVKFSEVHYVVSLYAKLHVVINTNRVRLDHLQGEWREPQHLRTGKKHIAQNVRTQVIGFLIRKILYSRGDLSVFDVIL